MAPESWSLPAWSLAAATVTGPTVGFNGMLAGLFISGSSIPNGISEPEEAYLENQEHDYSQHHWHGIEV